MRILLLLFSVLACVNACVETSKCAASDESSVTTAEVVADMKETLLKSKKFLLTMETTLHEFIVDLEAKMQMDKRQLEHAQRNADHKASCELEKACEAKVAAALESCKETTTYSVIDKVEENKNNATSGEDTTPKGERFTPPPKKTDDKKTTITDSITTRIRRKVKWPANACVLLVHSNTSTLFVNITGYPKIVATELDIEKSETLNYFDNEARKVIVRPAQVNGMSTVHCKCDPLKTNRKKKQEKKECIKHHTFNKKTKRCEWYSNPDYASTCGEITNNEGETQWLNIPNWPINKRYDVNLEQAGLTDFHEKVSSIIVRNGCFATMHTGSWLDSSKTLETVGYGNHDVTGDTLRVICECMNNDSNSGSGPETACGELTNSKDEKTFFNVDGENIAGKHDLSSLEDWEHKVVSATVRQGCMATFWSMVHSENKDSERTILTDVEYGTYDIDSVDKGTAGGGQSSAGVVMATCLCDPTRLKLLPPPSSVPACFPNHTYNDNTGNCEYWPHNKRYSVNLGHANITSFYRKVTSIQVRQHCFASIWGGYHLDSLAVLPTKSYGNYSVPSFYNDSAKKEEEGAERVVCECMY